MEQATHHPPASCWYMVDEKKSFRFFGSAEYHAYYKGNSITAYELLLLLFNIYI